MSKSIISYKGVRILSRVQFVIETFKKLNNEYKKLYQKLVFIMEMKSIEQAAETSEHIKNVSKMAYRLAMAYGLSEEESKLIRLASPLHDVGKAIIPAKILNKPARLTEEEFNVVKMHSKAGYDVLKNRKHKIFDAAAIIALQHHEKYNGKGYPDGLKGEEIHIYAQITAIADVFDALQSPRVYKTSYSLNEAIRIMKKEKGEHFSPVLVDCLLKIVSKDNKNKKNY